MVKVVDEQLLTGYDAVRSALMHPDLAQALYDEGSQVMADSLITLHGEEHRARRVMEFGVFTRRFFRTYERDLFPAVVAPVIERSRRAGELDLVAFAHEVTMNLTAQFAGVDYVHAVNTASPTANPTAGESDSVALLRLVKTFSEGATLVHSQRDRALAG